MARNGPSNTGTSNINNAANTTMLQLRRVENSEVHDYSTFHAFKVSVVRADVKTEFSSNECSY